MGKLNFLVGGFSPPLKFYEGRDRHNKQCRQTDSRRHIICPVNSDIIMHLPFGFISCLFSPDLFGIYEAKLTLCLNINSIWTVQNLQGLICPKLSKKQAKCAVFASRLPSLISTFCHVLKVWNASSWKGTAFTTSLMIILLFCIIRRRV